MHRGRPVESGSTVPRFHTELVPCVNKRYHRSLYRPQPPPTHQCPLYNDCKHSIPSAHPCGTTPAGAVPFHGTGTGTMVPVPICAQARGTLCGRSRPGVLPTGPGTVSRARLSDVGSLPCSAGVFAGDGTGVAGDGTGAPGAGGFDSGGAPTVSFLSSESTEGFSSVAAIPTREGVTK